MHDGIQRERENEWGQWREQQQQPSSAAARYWNSTAAAAAATYAYNTDKMIARPDKNFALAAAASRAERENQ